MKINIPLADSRNRFVMPYQMSPIPPLDPKICIAQYSQLKKMVLESNSRTSCSTPDRSDTNYTPSLDEPMDEDSKSSEPANSIEFCSENSNSDEIKFSEEKVHMRRKVSAEIFQFLFVYICIFEYYHYNILLLAYLHYLYKNFHFRCILVKILENLLDNMPQPWQFSAV